MTSCAYDNANLVTTAPPPAPGGVSRATKYAYDSDGKVVTVTSPLQQNTSLFWTSDFVVNKLQEPGTTAPLQYTSNSNGYLTDKVDQLGGTTHLGFTNLAIDADDNSS